MVQWFDVGGDAKPMHPQTYVSPAIDPAPAPGRQLTSGFLADPIGEDDAENAPGRLWQPSGGRGRHDGHSPHLEPNRHTVDDQRAVAMLRSRHVGSGQRVDDLLNVRRPWRGRAHSDILPHGSRIREA